MVPNIEVIVGTYEQFLLGYTIDDIVNKYKMDQSFATHSHLASIRSVSTSKHYLASAAADDTVCLYDLRNRTESGKLVHHTDTVNSISFTPDGSHIITASSDGTMGIVRCGNWQVEKHWLKPHKGLSVDMLAVHPSGKLAMTTGHDGVLRTWNLVKGRQAYATNLVPRWKMEAKQITVLKWSPDGQSYLLAANNRIDIYSIESAGIKGEITFENKVVCAEYLSDEIIAIGLADGQIVTYNLESNSKIAEIQAHDARVKCLGVRDDLLVSASSSGEIKLWSINNGEPTFLNKVNCSARISCLTLTTCQAIKKKQDEIVVEEKVLEKPSNRLKSKQTVTIELEEEEPVKTTRMSKKKRDKKKARKLLEEANDENNDTQQAKKAKTNSFENSSAQKKQKTNEKKKKMLVSPQKRKSDDEEVETELPIKKKKKKNNEEKIIQTNKNNNKNIIQKNNKKRKSPPEDSTNDSPKKPKVLAKTANVAALQKKRKKKQVKNKVPR